MVDLAPTVKVNGTTLAADLVNALISVRVDRALGVVGRAKLVFHDREYALSQKDTLAIGGAVTIDAPSARPSGSSELVPVFRGEITGAALEQTRSGAVEYTVVVDEMTHRLRRNTRLLTFLQRTYAQIISDLAQQCGLTSSVSSAEQIVHEYTLVTGSALSFLDEATRRMDAEWFADLAANKVVVRPVGSAQAVDAVLDVRDDLQRFSVRANSEAPTTVNVTGWDSQTQRSLASETVPVHPLESTFVQAAPGRGRARTADKLRLAASRPTTADEAKVIGRAAMNEAWANAVTARGTTSGAQPHLTLGGLVEVKGAGPAAGRYRVTELEHVFDSQGFRTTFVAGSHRPSGLVDLLDRPGGDAGFQRHQLVVGKVTDNNDPDKNGRVKVNLVTMPEVESTWARVLSPDAGTNRGIVFLPEINDEVLVAFEHGDTRRPIVLGGLYSGKTKLPTKDQSNITGSKVNQRRITSRSGHMLELDDSDGKEMVTLHHKAGHEVTLDAKNGVTVKAAANQPILLDNGNAKVTMTAAGDVTVEGVNITLKAKTKVSVEAMMVEVKATSQAKVEGKVVEVKSGGVATVEATGPLQLKGAIVKVN